MQNQVFVHSKLRQLQHCINPKDNVFVHPFFNENSFGLHFNDVANKIFAIACNHLPNSLNQKIE